MEWNGWLELFINNIIYLSFYEKIVATELKKFALE